MAKGAMAGGHMAMIRTHFSAESKMHWAKFCRGQNSVPHWKWHFLLANHLKKTKRAKEQEQQKKTKRAIEQEQKSKSKSKRAKGKKSKCSGEQCDEGQWTTYKKNKVGTMVLACGMVANSNLLGTILIWAGIILPSFIKISPGMRLGGRSMTWWKRENFHTYFMFVLK